MLLYLRGEDFVETLELHEVTTLPKDYDEKFSGITFDGCFFYLTISNKNCVYQFDKDFKQVGCLKTIRPYAGICYDYFENCFWTFEDRIDSPIYKLNFNFKEMDQIKVNDVCSTIRGISYDCDKDVVVVAYSDQIIEVSKKDNTICTLQKDFIRLCDGVLSISPYHAVILSDEFDQKIKFYDEKNRTIKTIELLGDYCIKDIVFYPCKKTSRFEIEIILLSTNSCNCSKIFHCNISGCDIKLCCCNYMIKKFHPGCRNKRKPCDCKLTCNDDQCVCDLIESIALVETALSHILNAEGEKLQKAVKVSDNIKDLLEINKSVQKTLTNVTFLENTLYIKLDALSALCKNSKLDTDS